MNRFAPYLPLIVLLSGCAAPGIAPSCSPGTKPMRIVELYFGRAMDGGNTVTDTAWEGFRAEVISPNFPDGYTVIDGTGAWLDPRTHTTVTEKTKILVVATVDSDASSAAVQRVRSAYEKAFQQNSVGMVTHLTCGSFDQ